MKLDLTSTEKSLETLITEQYDSETAAKVASAIGRTQWHYLTFTALSDPFNIRTFAGYIETDDPEDDTNEVATSITTRVFNISLLMLSADTDTTIDFLQST